MITESNSEQTAVTIKMSSSCEAKRIYDTQLATVYSREEKKPRGLIRAVRLDPGGQAGGWGAARLRSLAASTPLLNVRLACEDGAASTATWMGRG